MKLPTKKSWQQCVKILSSKQDKHGKIHKIIFYIANLEKLVVLTWQIVEKKWFLNIKKILGNYKLCLLTANTHSNLPKSVLTMLSYVQSFHHKSNKNCHDLSIETAMFYITQNVPMIETKKKLHWLVWRKRVAMM